jgi:hypothetical protein
MSKYQEYDITIKSFKETDDSIIASITINRAFRFNGSGASF